MMRTDSINGEIIYPTIGLYAWNIEDPQVGQAACRIYNDWILERLGGHRRIKVAGMIPTWDLEMARAEVERIADNASIGGILLPLVGTPEWNMPEWEPLWSAIAATGKSVVMHQGTGHNMIFYRGWGARRQTSLPPRQWRRGQQHSSAVAVCSSVILSSMWCWLR